MGGVTSITSGNEYAVEQSKKTNLVVSGKGKKKCCGVAGTIFAFFVLVNRAQDSFSERSIIIGSDAAFSLTSVGYFKLLFMLVMLGQCQIISAEMC